jgi:hypothetical protein
MAKLYWRYKKDGKWTWRPAETEGEDDSLVIVLKENMYDYIPSMEEE